MPETDSIFELARHPRNQRRRTASPRRSPNLKSMNNQTRNRRPRSPHKSPRESPQPRNPPRNSSPKKNESPNSSKSGSPRTKRKPPPISSVPTKPPMAAPQHLKLPDARAANSYESYYSDSPTSLTVPQQPQSVWRASKPTQHPDSAPSLAPMNRQMYPLKQCNLETSEAEREVLDTCQNCPMEKSCQLSEQNYSRLTSRRFSERFALVENPKELLIDSLETLVQSVRPFLSTILIIVLSLMIVLFLIEMLLEIFTSDVAFLNTYHY